MFYENERIINKQLKFTKSRAYEVIQDLEGKGLSEEEIKSCINLMLSSETTEFQKDVLKEALRVISKRQEKADEIQIIDTTYSFVDGRVQCKVRAPKVPTPRKRKTLVDNKNRKEH